MRPVATAHQGFVGFSFWLAILLSSCAPDPLQTPAGVVRQLYTVRITQHMSGSPTRNELVAMTPYLTKELASLLERARELHDAEVARAPGDKPPFAERDLFSSLFEGPTGIEVLSDSAVGDTHQLVVRFTYDGSKPADHRTDRVVVVREKDRFVVADVEYGGGGDSANRGSLVSLLTGALSPSVGEEHSGEAPAPTSPTGVWTVVGHRMPGVSAMTNAEAMRWHGRTVSFGPNQAISGADTCARPVYHDRMVPTDSLLSVGYHVTAKALGLDVARQPRLRITEVSCNGAAWPAMGNVLLWADDRSAFAVWDGVFFELRSSGR